MEQVARQDSVEEPTLLSSVASLGLLALTILSEQQFLAFRKTSDHILLDGALTDAQLLPLAYRNGHSFEQELPDARAHFRLGAFRLSLLHPRFLATAALRYRPSVS